MIKGKRYAELRWKRDVRYALIELKMRGLAVDEKRGLWRFTSPET